MLFFFLCEGELMINLVERDCVWVNRLSGEGGRKIERL